MSAITMHAVSDAHHWSLDASLTCCSHRVFCQTFSRRCRKT